MMDCRLFIFILSMIVLSLLVSLFSCSSHQRMAIEKVERVSVTDSTERMHIMSVVDSRKVFSRVTIRPADSIEATRLGAMLQPGEKAILIDRVYSDSKAVTERDSVTAGKRKTEQVTETTKTENSSNEKERKMLVKIFLDVIFPCVLLILFERIRNRLKSD